MSQMLIQLLEHDDISKPNTWYHFLKNLLIRLRCYRTHINFYSRQCLFFKYNENTVNEIPNSTEYSDDITIGIDDFTFIYSFPPCVAQEIKYYSYTYLTKLAKQIPFLFIYVWVILLLNVKISINTAGIKVKLKCV